MNGSVPPVDDLSFAVATSADVSAVVELVQSAYRGDASRQGWTSEADFLEGQRVDAAMVGALIDSAGAVVLLARSAGRLVGCCELSRRDDGSAYLGMFAVDPTLQARGIGRRILAAADRFVSAEWGAGRVVITVIDIRDELIAWYERQGFERTGASAPFPYGDERFGIPLRDDLRFVELAKNLSPVPDEG